ncbi:DUF4142 domain-containing protein [Sphingomonas sp. BAUL-RG-20F-R05-02]|uniref:DUF4142 domain-containing protein n=1 Tax=Sphingomonas sp. BAUL-RG-20F-R05-02 TaxID=2914830 RepID=UPI001F5A89B1|nr:DUF4142 domain-containing protein [Sphingomonas sp. BAUL-RG-20F-R05-02]
MRKILLMVAPLLAIASPALANPQDFLNKAMMGDNSETALGKLAASRAANPGVRQYGAMLATDHAKGRREILPMVKRYRLPSTTALAPAADAERYKLGRLHGAAFDHEFVRYMIQDHTDDISDFRGELKSGDPAEVRAIAQRTLPVLQKHLKTAQALQAKQSARRG